MLKMYVGNSTSGGSTPEFWDENWEHNEVGRVLADVRIAENDPVHQILVEKVRRDGLFLEGGCGQAQWVKYFAERGYRAVGIDFATRTVEKVHRVAPDIDVRVGNILALPFADGEVQSYYSGGVVEHFETGPEPALREARRVLSDDGWFLCSVPDESFLRRRLFRDERSQRLDLDPTLTVERVDHAAETVPPGGQGFFQYAYTEAEFTRILADAGFVVDRTFGYGLVWGLMELPKFQRLYRGGVSAARALRDQLRPHATATDIATVGDATVAAANGQSGHHGLGGWLRRAIVKEDRSTPLIGPVIGTLCEYCSNMRMYVARPRV